MEFIHFALLLLLTLYCLTKVHFLFTLSLLLWVVFFLVFSHFILKKSTSLAKETTESRSVISGYLADYITNIVNVRLFSRFSFEQGKLSLLAQDFVNKSQKQSLFLSNYYLTQGIISGIYGTSFVIGLVYLHRQNIITAGDFALVFMLNFSIFRHLYGLSHQLRDFISNIATIDKHLSFFEESKVNYYNHLIGKSLIQIQKGEIRFDKVNFHYKKTYPLFDNISVLIKPGEKIGLVGLSGSGKTSFVNLLLGLYEIQEGAIYIDGQNINDISQDSLYESISMIPQDPSLFHRTIKENIAYGKIKATDEEIKVAAEKAHAYFIANLPEGYNSLVGERGIKLSGGQRQRIAIARAILKNAPILILDEATSQLDSITENYIQDSLWDIIKDKTTIIIAHRLSTILHMDRLLVFDQGMIVEDGTHNELLAKNGLYKSLWEAQKDGFLPIYLSNS